MPDIKDSVSRVRWIRVYLDYIDPRLKFGALFLVFIEIPTDSLVEIFSFLTVHSRCGTSVNIVGVGPLPPCFNLNEQKKITVFGDDVDLASADVDVLTDDVESLVLEVQCG